MNVSILDEVRQIVADLFNIPLYDIRADSSPDTLDVWDSLQHLNLILALEQNWGVQFLPEEIEKMTTVRAAAAMVEESSQGTEMDKSSSEMAGKPAGFDMRVSRRPLVYGMGAVIGAAIAFKLLSYRSTEPWILGHYSLPYFIFLVALFGGSAFIAFLFHRFRWKTLYIIAAWVILFVLAIAGIEVAGQIYAFLYPSYRVLSFQPDRVVGWKLVPHLHYTWGGHYWYAREFSVPIAINSYGFRDTERSPAKQSGTLRVGLLGDSMVEAMQVPFEKTAAHVLEERLNSAPPNRIPQRYEVLNFAVSNYGVGQYLLAWEQYASRFSPDYVFILVGEIHMDRTVTKYESSAVSATANPLWVRPTFRIANGKLLREPAQDFDKFVNAQNELVQNELGGKRMARRHHELFIAPFLKISLWNRLMELQRKLSREPKSAQAQSEVTVYQPMDKPAVDVNLKVIEQLGEEIRRAGGQLVVVDASRYFHYLKWEPLTGILKDFCATKGFGWIPLGDELLAAEKNGVLTRWPYDQHFNETGNKMFADAMYRWLAETNGGSASGIGSSSGRRIVPKPQGAGENLPS